MGKPTYLLQSVVISAAMLTLVACGGQAPAAPAKPTEAAAAKPTEAPAKPAGAASPAASPGASPAASPAAAASPSPAASPAAAAGAAAKPASGPSTKLGNLTPLSPPGDATAGQLITRGAELAVEYINQRMGSGWNASCNLPGPIELVTVDDSGTPEKAVAGFRKLATDDKVAAVFGQFHSSDMLAIAPIADQLKLPTMSTQASNSGISGNHNEFVFQSHVVDNDRAQVVAQFVAANKDKFKKVGVVAENTDYGTGSTAEFKKWLSQGAPEVQEQDWIFDRTSADISPLLLQVKGFDPDLVYNLAVGAPAYLMAKQGYDTGLLPKSQMLISYDIPIRQEFWDNLGDKGNGMVYVAYYSPQQKISPAGQWVKEQYEKKYNEPILYTSLQGFGNELMLAQAINKACSTDGEAIQKALEQGGLMNWNSDSSGFPRADGIDWHRIKMPILILQYTAPNQTFDKATILYPAEMKTGDYRKIQ